MPGSRKVLNLTVWFFIMTAVFAATAYCAEKAILNTFLNTEEKGERFVMLTEDRLLMKPEDLLEMGFRDLPEGVPLMIEEYLLKQSRG